MKKILALILLLLLSSSAFCQDFPTLTTPEMKKIVSGKGRVVVIDARTAQEYREGHIPKAVSVPPEKVATIATVLPKDKKTPLIFYCRGYT